MWVKSIHLYTLRNSLAVVVSEKSIHNKNLRAWRSGSAEDVTDGFIFTQKCRTELSLRSTPDGIIFRRETFSRLHLGSNTEEEEPAREDEGGSVCVCVCVCPDSLLSDLYQVIDDLDALINTQRSPLSSVTSSLAL